MPSRWYLKTVKSENLCNLWTYQTGSVSSAGAAFRRQPVRARAVPQLRAVPDRAQVRQRVRLCGQRHGALPPDLPRHHLRLPLSKRLHRYVDAAVIAELSGEVAKIAHGGVLTVLFVVCSCVLDLFTLVSNILVFY